MLKRLLDRFKGWREKRASLQYLADVESRMFFEYAKFQLRDLKRKEEMRKLWRKIHKRDSQRSYVV